MHTALKASGMARPLMMAAYTIFVGHCTFIVIYWILVICAFIPSCIVFGVIKTVWVCCCWNLPLVKWPHYCFVKELAKLYQAYVHCTQLFTQWPRWPLLLSRQVKVLQVRDFFKFVLEINLVVVQE